MIAWISTLVLSSSLTPTLPTEFSTPVGDTDPVEFEVKAKKLSWEKLSPNVFDRKWILPEPRTVPGPNLLAEMRSLIALRFDILAPDGNRYRCFGDLVAAANDLNHQARQDWLDLLAPVLSADFENDLGKLIFDERLHSEEWKPSKSHAHDGLLLGSSWNMEREKKGPWSEVDVRPLMEQAAILLRADLANVKSIENDYRAYPDNVGMDYEEIYPVDGSYFVGSDSDSRPFSTLSLRFRCDLPFPFTTYSTLLRILNRFDESGVLYTDIYSTSNDFYWMAGRDVFLPVTTTDGEWVAFLLVRHFGFDLDGVPDGSDDRQEALRSSLGNLKRNSERLYRNRPEPNGAPRNSPTLLHSVRVLGRK
ncbi:MAG: hypothetical protein ACI8X5_002514 [Planctomycetota bacterium]|jgi:hypothetical protein